MALKKTNEITNQTTKDIIAALHRDGCYPWRQNVAAIVQGDHTRAASKKGVADILSCYPYHPPALAITVGLLVCVEVKTGADKQSPEQVGFMENIRHVAGIYIVARDCADFLSQWQIIKAQLNYAS